MGFLKLLEGIRMPWLDSIMSAITNLGSETFFMAVGIIIFWCVSKRQGYYLLAVGFLGTLGNQFMKLWFRIPRPWVIDPNLTIVESARAGATGYSFPSGHSQSVVCTLGVVAVSNKQKWLRILCVVLMLLIPFSRMYLGVHTPLDVGVGAGGAILLVILMYPMFKTNERADKFTPWAIVVLIVASVAYLIFCLCYNFPAEVYTDPDENLIHGTKNAFTILGSGIALLLDFYLEKKYVRFDTKATFLGNVLKVTLGLGLLVGIRVVLKAPLLALFNGSEIASAVRYFCIVLFGGCIWPMTFPFFAKIGAKKEAAKV
ncbi:MAG: phosphatase PAP2 family protein [Bacillota bacterium]|nr:phosphatase PAP2 family protein [Bacillota bacterium]